MSASIVNPEPADRVAVITGASGGIGSEIAARFGQAGYKILAHGRNRDALESVVQPLRREGVDAVAFTGNLREPAVATGLVAAAVAEWGRVDVVINNAGGNFWCPLDELSDGGWQATLEANLYSVFYVCRAALPELANRESAAIVNVASTAAAAAHPGRGAYAAAKAGVISLTKTMAWEWAERGVRVNSVSPGPTEIARSRFSSPQPGPSATDYVALGRLGRPRDVADACLFLCSDASSYITGEDLRVAGGPDVAVPSDVFQLRDQNRKE